MEIEKETFSYELFKEIAKPFIEKENVTDFHIAVGTGPFIRQAKKLVELRLPGTDDDGNQIWIPINPMTADDTKQFVEDLIHDAQRDNPEEVADSILERMYHEEIDTTLSLPGISRFRVHICRQRATFTCALRVVPQKIPELSGFPSEMKSLTQFHNGLVIIAGKAGSGKSTTQATLVNDINNNQQKKIITLEDPIEYLHRHARSMVIQREIRTDTKDYKTGLLSALREDPDIIVIGELRDLESFEIALNAAESGCLVLATMHSANTAETLERIVSMFPDDKQNQARSQLATVLRGIVCQQLIPCAKPSEYGSPLVCAFEVCSPTTAILNNIRQGNFKDIMNNMQTAPGNRLMRDSLQGLKDAGLISEFDWFNRYNVLIASQSK